MPSLENWDIGLNNPDKVEARDTCSYSTHTTQAIHKLSRDTWIRLAFSARNMPDSVKLSVERKI